MVEVQTLFAVNLLCNLGQVISPLCSSLLICKNQDNTQLVGMASEKGKVRVLLHGYHLITFLFFSLLVAFFESLGIGGWD